MVQRTATPQHDQYSTHYAMDSYKLSPKPLTCSISALDILIALAVTLSLYGSSGSGRVRMMTI